MFDIGFSELVMVAVVALIVLGPHKLPQAIRTVGLYIGRIKSLAASVQNDVNEQLALEEMRKRLAEHEEKVKSGLITAKQHLESTVDLDANSATNLTTPVPTSSAPSSADAKESEPNNATSSEATSYAQEDLTTSHPATETEQSLSNQQESNK